MTANLDPIYIELKVIAAHGNDIWMQGDIEIKIGNQKPYTEDDMVDTEALLESMEADGEYFIFSCICGIPECGGWTEGIKVSHEGDLTRWVDPNYGRAWTFDRQRMLADIQTVREEAAVFKRFFEEKGIQYVGVGYNW